MSFKHILLEFYQWCGWKMKSRRAKIKVAAVVCVLIAGILIVQYLNMKMMEQQYGGMEDFGTYGKMEQTSDTLEKQNADSNSGTKWSGRNDPDAVKKETDSSETENAGWSSEDYGNPMEMVQPTWQTSAIMIAGILAVAIIAAMVMYLRYRDMHVDSIPPLFVMQDKGEDA